MAIAQQTVILNQSAYNIYLSNPAAAGLHSETNLNVYFRKQWAGISDSPQFTGFSIDGAINDKKIGLGCIVFSEQAGVFSKTIASVAYRYKFKISDTSHLILGLAPGIRSQQIDFSKIKAEDPGEFSQLPLRQVYTVPDVSAGILYLYRNLEAGFSASQLLPGKFRYNEPFYNVNIAGRLVPFYQVHLKHTVNFMNNRYKYIPALFLRTIQGLPVQIDFSNTVIWSDRFLLGVGYKQAYNTYLNIGYLITGRLRVVYSYEHSFNGRASIKGAHEFGLRFNLSPLTGLDREIIPFKNKQVDEIYEKIDLQEQKLERTGQKVDTIDRNLNYLKEEIEKIKKGELNKDEFKKQMDDFKKSSEGKAGKKEKYIKIDSPNRVDELKDAAGARYNIILGVFKNFDYAKSCQKILEREFGIKTKLIEAEGSTATLFYISLPNDYEKVKDSSEEFSKIRKFLSKQPIQILNGEPWILQTNK